MSWAQNVSQDSALQNYFVRLGARLYAPTFTNYSGNVYYASFAYGDVFNVADSNVADLTEVASIAALVSNLQYFWDEDAQRLYMYSSTDPNLATYVVEFFLYYASRDCLWHKIPDDESTGVVMWKGVLTAAPEYKLITPPLAFGFCPTEPSSMEIRNDQSLNYIAYHGSFNRCFVDCWNQSGELEEDNVSRVVAGIVGMDIKVTDEKIDFQVLDRSFNFDGHVSGNYFGTSLVDPKFAGTATLDLWGRADDDANFQPLFEMANLNYVPDAAAFSNNDRFGLVYDDASKYNEWVCPGTIRPGGADRFRFTNPDHAELFEVGGIVWVTGASANTYGLVIDGFGGTGPQAIFTSSPGGPINQAGNIHGHFIRDVYYVDEGKNPIRLTAGLHYLPATHAGNIKGITLDWFNIITYPPSGGNPLGENFRIFCHVTGKQTRPTYNAVEVVDELTNANTYTGRNVSYFSLGMNILFDFLKTKCDMTDADIDYPAFQAAALVADWSMFLPCPISQLSDLPTKREMIDLMLKSMTLRAWFNNEGLFTVKAYQPATSVDSAATVEKEDIIDKSYQIDYSNLASVQFPFAWDALAKQRIALSGTKADFIAGTAYLKLLEGDFVPQINAAGGSLAARVLHQTGRAEVVEHIATRMTNQQFYERVRDLYGQRFGTMSLTTRRHFFERAPNDIVTVSTPDLVGVEYTGDDQTNELLVSEVTKSEDTIQFTLDDTKAAKDGQGEDYW